MTCPDGQFNPVDGNGCVDSCKCVVDPCTGVPQCQFLCGPDPTYSLGTLQPGLYGYHCGNHGQPDGSGMAGALLVVP